MSLVPFLWTYSDKCCSWACNSEMQKGKRAKPRSSNSSNQNKTWLGMRNDQRGFEGIHPRCEPCILSIHRTAVSTHELDFSSQLEATQKSVHSGIIMRTCVCLRRCVWRVRGALAVPQRCLEAATNAPNYKTTCENWGGVHGKMREIEQSQTEACKGKTCVFM